MIYINILIVLLIFISPILLTIFYSTPLWLGYPLWLIITIDFFMSAVFIYLNKKQITSQILYRLFIWYLILV